MFCHSCRPSNTQLRCPAQTDSQSDDKGILATVFLTGKRASYPTFEDDLHFVRSTDFFGSFESQVLCVSTFVQARGHVFLSVPNSCPVDMNGKPSKAYAGGNPNMVKLYVSNNGGMDFQEICIP